MGKISVNDYLIKLIYVCSFAIIIFQLFEKNGLVSIAFYSIMVISVCLWLINIIKGMDLLDIIVIFIILFAFLNVLLNSALEGSEISFSYLKKYMIFSITIMYLKFSEKNRITIEQKKFIGNCVDFSVIILILSFFAKGSELYYMAGRISPYLTFKFTNPNLTGLFLVCFIVTEIILLANEKCKKKIFYRIMLSAFLFYFILKTQARASILATLFLCICSITIICSKRKTYRISRIYAIVFTCFPAVFVYIYMCIIKNPAMLNALSFFSSKGKELSSREYVWKEGINAFIESPIIGAYSQNSNGTGAFQLHNTHLDIISSYGVLVFILVCVLLYCFIHKKGRIVKKQDIICNIGFATIIFMGIGEAALFSGGLCIFVFASIPLLFSECKWEKGYRI